MYYNVDCCPSAKRRKRKKDRLKVLAIIIVIGIIWVATWALMRAGDYEYNKYHAEYGEIK